MRHSRGLLILLTCWFSVAAHSKVLAKSIDEVKLTPESLAPSCSAVQGEHPISVQAATLYAMVGTPNPMNLLDSVLHKDYQSFACSGAESTIYYYEFDTKDAVDEALVFVKPLIWGEGGRSSMHPEFIFSIENILIVISSRDAEFFANDFFYGVPGKTGEAFGKAMDMYGKKDYVEAEKEFRALTRSSPDLLLGHLYLGHSLFFQARYHDSIPSYERARAMAAKSGGLNQLNQRILSDQLGMAYALDGRMPDAKGVFEATIRTDPDYPMSYYNLACAFAEMGDLHKALANLKLGYARREHVLPGEEYPDPRTDDSFKKYVDNEEFKATMKELGY
jgi:tetratricopeptide (TPR) repeat protein